jgi:hypothetical protein
MTHSATPLDTVDIPEGAVILITHQRWLDDAWTSERLCQSPEVARGHVAWLMAMANVQHIRVTIAEHESYPRGIHALLEIGRPDPLAPWHCPQVPDWDIVIDERAAVAEAVRIVEAHQHRRSA